MSNYRRRFSMFPRPILEQFRESVHFDGLGAPPAGDAKDPQLAYPIPVTDPTDPNAAQRKDLPIWLYPPVNWENIDQVAYALLPAIGSTVVIVSFQVPTGRNGVINKLANNFVGGGWTEGTGDVLWRILVDGAPPPAATSYASIVASLGAPANPVGISGFRIFENQVVTVVAFNNPAGPNGGVVVAGQRVGARLLGHLYPRSIEDSDIWI